jgi:hypothetical protein
LAEPSSFTSADLNTNTSCIVALKEGELITIQVGGDPNAHKIELSSGAFTSNMTTTTRSSWARRPKKSEDEWDDLSSQTEE